MFSNFSKTMTDRKFVLTKLEFWAGLVGTVFKKRANGVQLGFLWQHAFLDSQPRPYGSKEAKMHLPHLN